ncbi:ribonuclease HII [Staphylococcus arlettae]|uniref:ribonuclease HII n=1 Tax=Staphylococcus arlettae TaxID=29378 RepID=UPI0022B4B049|nr:ribonuclease HII [Staphylococcus arlettae]
MFLKKLSVTILSKQTIKDIKKELQTITSLESLAQSEHQLDERKGVKLAITQRQKQLEKDVRLREQYVEMTQFETNIAKQHQDAVICGIDEVGRGPLAGPVVTCAVILDPTYDFIGINDSKQLSADKRQQLQQEIQTNALDYAYGVASVKEIDTLNIYQATKLAMLRAVQKLTVTPSHLLIDAMEIDTDIAQISLIKGDARSISIAAASILAKEYRDQYMKDLAETYPGYAFEKNVGYGTQAHLDGITRYGVTEVHRKSFEPIKSKVKNLEI